MWVVVVFVDRFYIALFSAFELTHCALMIDYLKKKNRFFYSTFLYIHGSGLQHCLIVTWLVPRETAAVSARSVYTIQPCTMSRHFMQIHIRRVHVCLVLTCHLHFWQNDRDLLLLR